MNGRGVGGEGGVVTQNATKGENVTRWGTLHAAGHPDGGGISRGKSKFSL